MNHPGDSKGRLSFWDLRAPNATGAVQLPGSGGVADLCGVPDKACGVVWEVALKGCMPFICLQR